MLTRAVHSTSRKPRNSYKTLSVTSDQVMNSPMKLSMRSSPPSTKTDPVPLRSPRWLSSSSNFLVDHEHDGAIQCSYNSQYNKTFEKQLMPPQGHPRSSRDKMVHLAL